MYKIKKTENCTNKTPIRKFNKIEDLLRKIRFREKDKTIEIKETTEDKIIFSSKNGDIICYFEKTNDYILSYQDFMYNNNLISLTTKNLGERLKYKHGCDKAGLMLFEIICDNDVEAMEKIRNDSKKFINK